MTFVLLTATVLLSAVFVGDWLFLSLTAAAPGQLPPLVWLVTPGGIVVVLMVVQTAVGPLILERRRHLVEVQPDIGAAALRRLAALSVESGIRTAPRLMWNPSGTGTPAFAYGRPGSYRIAVPQVMLGLARRRPADFDDVARHELAHIRNGDVWMAWSALYCWYAVALVLAAPPAARLVDHDWSLMPEYLLRTAALALLLYLIRARLLRSRESWADVTAASRAADPSRMARRFEMSSRGAGSRPRRVVPGWLTLHPSPGRRARAITRPALLGRPASGEWLIVGVLAGASVPLVVDLLVGSDHARIVDADTTARALAFGCTGLYAAPTLARAAGTGTLSRGRGVQLAAVLAAGTVVGTVVSLGRTGLRTTLGPDVVAAAVTAVAVGSVLVLVGALAQVPRLHAPARSTLTALAVTGAALTGLAAASSLTTSRVLADAGSLPTPADQLFMVANGWPVHLLAPACLVAALAGVALARSLSDLRRPVAVAAALGVAMSLVLSAVRPLLGDLHVGDRAWQYYLAWIWTGIALTVLLATATAARRSEGLLVAFPAAAVVAAVAAVGFVVSADAFGGRFTLGDALSSLSLITAGALSLGLPVAALAQLRPGRRAVGRRPWSVPGDVSSVEGGQP